MEERGHPLRSAPGTYALLLESEADEGRIDVGALGALTVRAPRYVYVGSAFGPGGLRARVRRHARGEGALHWHIDYLRAVTTLSAVWYTYDVGRRECDWATAFHTFESADIPLSGFGASECTCPAHLAAFEAPPALSAFRKRIMARHARHAAIGRRTGPTLPK